MEPELENEGETVIELEIEMETVIELGPDGD